MVSFAEAFLFSALEGEAKFWITLYTGKTTTAFSKRFNEHFQKNSNSAVHDHSRHCQIGKRMNDFSIQFLENVHSRGKYSLSEREHLWNSRLRGIVNIQKTLMSQRLGYDIYLILFVLMLLMVMITFLSVFLQKSTMLTMM